MIKKMHLFFLLILLLPDKGYTQVLDTFGIVPDTLAAIKRECGEGLEGSRIQILEGKADVALYRKGLLTHPLQEWYSYSLLYNAPPEMKVNVLEQLLSFQSDSAWSCLPVEPYWDMAVDSFSRILSKRYSIQIDALFHFNRICFGQYAQRYSPFPVLYDNQTQQEINNDADKIREVFNIYHHWFDECKIKGFKNYSLDRKSVV